MQEMRKSPCYQCDERELFCHMLCARYAEFRANIDQALLARRSAADYRACVKEAVRRMETESGVDMRGGAEKC